MGQPARDDVADALRDREPNRGRRLGPDALDGEQPHDLADEERIAFGLVVQRRDELGRGELRRRELDVLCDLALAEPAQ